MDGKDLGGGGKGACTLRRVSNSDSRQACTLEAYQLEAQALHGLNGKGDELPLLVCRQGGGAVGARLIEVPTHPITVNS